MRTRKPELQLVWACFLLGLWGQRKTRTSLKSFNTTDVERFEDESSRLGVQHTRFRTEWEAAGVGADTLPRRGGVRACVLGSGGGRGTPETCAWARRSQTPTSRSGRDKRASGQGRKERKKHLEQNPPALPWEAPLSLLRLWALDHWIPENSQGEQNTVDALPQLLQDTEPHSHTEQSRSQL